MVKRIFLIAGAVILTGCAGGPFDVNNGSNLGLRCSTSAHTAPNWSSCLEKAQTYCGNQKVTNIAQHSPTKSGYADDAYFMTFQCH
ncbi:hypothetical protein [Basilea psittacipulmonis]|uniref:hypothetical protein n=1 Tax=Basilea psittacipulmonis TaxID=1472345 RepID=UPI000689AB02|nr:hypothetical protein [Basilea psittacipulmonis]